MKKIALLAILMLVGCNTEVQASATNDGAKYVISCDVTFDVDGQNFYNVRLYDYEVQNNRYHIYTVGGSKFIVPMQFCYIKDLGK